MKMNKIPNFQNEYRFLSNFYLVDIEYDGIIYPSLEHAYQAAKTLDIEDRISIQQNASPASAKRKGRHLTIREDWDDVKISIMRELLYKKFNNKYLASKLIQTNELHIEEGNTWGDTFWGVCNGVGENNLGKLLMEVREYLNDKKTQS